jgi:hypothetical protein
VTSSEKKLELLLVASIREPQLAQNFEPSETDLPQFEQKVIFPYSSIGLMS